MRRKSRPKGGTKRPARAERERRVEKIREEVRKGTYDDDEKLRLALDRMIDRLLERSKR